MRYSILKLVLIRFIRKKKSCTLFTSYVIGQVLYDANDTVIGIATNDMGIAKDGSTKENFQRGVELKGKLFPHLLPLPLPPPSPPPNAYMQKYFLVCALRVSTC